MKNPLSWWQALTTPRAKDPDEAQREYLTKAVLVCLEGLFLVDTLLIAIAWGLGLIPFYSVLIMLALDLLVIGVYGLACGKHMVVASYAPSAISFGFALYITYKSGLLSTGLLFFLIAIVLAAMLQGGKAKWLMVALSISGYLIIAVLKYHQPTGELVILGTTISFAFVGIALLEGFYIAQVKRLFARAHESEEQARQLFERVPVGLYRTTPDGQITDANLAMGEMLGYPDRDSILNVNARDLYVEPEARDQVIKSSLKDGLLRGYEMPLRRQDGEVIWVRDSFRAVHDSKGEVICYEGSLENITNRKLADEQLRRKAEELEVLHAVSLELTASHESSSLLQMIVEQATRLLGATGGGLYLCNYERQEVCCVASYKTPRDFTETTLKFGEGAAGIVALTGEPLNISDYRTWSSRALVYEGYQPFRSVLSCPMIRQGKVLGVIHVLHDTDVGRFTQNDLILLTLFADQAAIALHNAQSYEAAQQRARRLALLNDITRASLEMENYEEMLQYLADRLGELIDADGSYLTFWDDDLQRATPVAAYGQFREQFPHISIEPGEMTLTESALRAGRGLIIADTANSPYLSPRLAAIFPSHSMIALPLIAGEQKLGAVTIAFNQPHAFTEDEISICEHAAAQIALAVSKLRLLKAQSFQVSELDALHATVTDISSELELPVLLRSILERAVNLLDASGGDLGLVDAETKDIQIVVSHCMGKDYAGTRIAIGEGAMGQALALEQPIVIQDYSQWEGRPQSYIEGDWHAAIAVPLRIGSRLVGALGIVDSDPERTFSPNDRYLLDLFAQQAAIAINNARLFSAEKKRAGELSVLYEISAMIAKSLDLTAAYTNAGEQLARVVDATSTHILSFDLNTRKAKMVYEYFSPNANDLESISDLGVTYDMSNYPQTLKALRDGTHLMIQIGDTNIDPQDREELLTYGIKSSLEVPMIVSGHISGFVQIWDSLTERSWSEGEIKLCQTLANQAAVAIENARLYSEMQKIAITDALTGVLNRRGLFEIGRREINRARRLSRPLSAIMLDIDHFKQVNDAYSHAIGDQVLQALARHCQMNLREMDTLGRYGGEEFAILLPESDGSAALLVAERLCKMIARTPMETNIGPIFITVSMGVSCTQGELIDLAVLLDRADTAMYLAKGAGRNQVAALEPAGIHSTD